jgi:hypothetical protein
MTNISKQSSYKTFGHKTDEVCRQIWILHDKFCVTSIDTFLDFIHHPVFYKLNTALVH